MWFFYYPYCNDNTAASCVWQTYFFQSGVGLKEVIQKYRPTACSLQRLGKVKQFSWIWLRRRAVQFESCRKDSSAFRKVVNPQPQCSKLLPPSEPFLSLSKCQTCFQDWNNSGSFPPLQGDLHAYFSMCTYPFTTGRYLESSLWQSLDLIKMSVQWIKPKQRIARKYKTFLPLPSTKRMQSVDLPWQAQPHNPGRWPLAAFRGHLHGLMGWQATPLLLGFAWSHLQGFEHHWWVGAFQQGDSLASADPRQVNPIHIQEDVTWDQ